MEYHRTKDILRIMKILGHKNIKNTLIYTPGEFPRRQLRLEGCLGPRVRLQARGSWVRVRHRNRGRKNL